MSNSNFSRNIGILMSLIIIALGLLYMCSTFGSKAYFTLSSYLVILLLYIVIKKVISFSYKSRDYDLLQYSVSVVIVVEGEDSEALVRLVKNLLNQDYPLKEILIININSKNLNIYYMAKKIRKQIELFKESGIKGEIDLGDIKSCPEIIIKKTSRNEDKSSAETWGFTRSTGNIVLICNNNSIIDNDGIKQLIKSVEDSFAS